MEYTKLGGSELSVPRICLGTNNFGGGRVEPEICKRILSKALDLGINMFDSANVYTKGESERIIGEFVKDHRNEVIITTKVGKEFGDEPVKPSLTRENITYQLDQSLDKLQTDYLDLYYVHQWDKTAPLEETLRTLDSLVKEGKIRHIACSNYSSKQLEESRNICEKFGLEKFIAVQNQYNLFSRRLEDDPLPYCLRNKIGVIAYSPYAGGLLAGRYEKGKTPPSGSRASFRKDYWDRINNESNFERLEKVRVISKESGISIPSLAIAWILRESRVTTAVVGASKPEQLEDSAKAASMVLDENTLDELRDV